MTPARSSQNLIHVLIADDSAVTREFLRELIDQEPDMLVVGNAINGAETVELAKTLKPDLITMDVNMPRLSGLEATRQIMSEVPTPIAIITSAPVGPGESTTYRAIDAGAVDVFAKPDRALLLGNPAKREGFIRQLRNVSRVGVVGIRHGSQNKATATPSTPPPAASDARTCGASPAETRVQGTLIQATAQVILLGASTGGPPCIRAVLDELQANSPPVVVAQHMSEQFLGGFAQWLDANCALKVHLAQSGQNIHPGNVYIAPGGRHLVMASRNRLAVLDGPPVHYQKPSVDVLFHSAANVVGADAIAVLLTGMGVDGAAGMRDLFSRGATTLTQSKETSLVYGMPAAAMELGASRLSASPPHIGRLLRRVRPKESQSA